MTLTEFLAGHDGVLCVIRADGNEVATTIPRNGAGVGIAGDLLPCEVSVSGWRRIALVGEHGHRTFVPAMMVDLA